MDYWIITSSYRENLTKEVNDLLKQGFSLHGYLIVTHTGGNCLLYTQAMIKY